MSTSRFLILLAAVLLILSASGPGNARPAHAEPVRSNAEGHSVAKSSVTDGRRTLPPQAIDAARAGRIGDGPASETSQAMRIVVGLTLLAVIPAALICATSFLRIIIVLSMLRHALGLPETPPNMVLVGLAVFLTLFTMGPVLEKLNDASVQPFLRGSASLEDVYRTGMDPLKDFMLRQTKKQDIALMVELSDREADVGELSVPAVHLIPAFMLSELRSAFQIGFLVFLPFLLVDLIVSSILMALGMMMVSPTTISLPLKILMFVLVDGWSLLLRALVGSFH